MIHILQKLSGSRFIWLSLLLLGIALECAGLYFQYSLRLNPCVNCVYERAFYLCFIFAGIIGFINPNFIVTRLMAIITFLAGSIGGMYVAYHHLKEYYNDNPLAMSCSFKANFPSFLPLDELMPWMFAPQGTCSPLNWELFSLSMPQWIFASFAAGTLVAASFLIACLCRRKKRDYIELYK